METVYATPSLASGSRMRRRLPVQRARSTAHQRTAEHAMTRPSISIPASANAVLAATEPDAIQLSIPSFSIMVRKMSIVDFGRSSSRTAGSNAC